MVMIRVSVPVFSNKDRTGLLRPRLGDLVANSQQSVSGSNLLRKSSFNSFFKFH